MPTNTTTSEYKTQLRKLNKKGTPIFIKMSVLIPHVIGKKLAKTRRKIGIFSHGITIPEKNEIRYSSTELNAPTRLKIKLNEPIKKPKP